MTYTQAIILNAIFAALVLAGLARIVWFGIAPAGEPSIAAVSEETAAPERLAA